MSFKVSWKMHIKVLLLAVIITLILRNTVADIIGKLFENPIIFYPTPFLLINFYIIVFALLFVITLVHEATHGIVYMLFGGKVKFGFKGIYAYTQEVSERPFHRTVFLAVLLAPVVLISIISSFLSSWIGGLVYFLNLLGSTGDLYMALFLCRLNCNNYIIDRDYGFDVV